MRYLFFILIILTFSNTFAQDAVTISGTIKSAVNGEPLDYMVISVAGTGIGVVTDSLGKYAIGVPKGELTLNIIYLGYIGFDTTLNVQNSIELNFLLNAECEFDKERAEQDIKKIKPKLLLVGSIAPIANTKEDKQFMEKYKISYFDFGDDVIAMECIEEYNKLIFQYLDKKYGANWRNDVRADVIGLD